MKRIKSKFLLAANLALLLVGGLAVGEAQAIGPKPDDPLLPSKGTKAIGPKPDDPLRRQSGANGIIIEGDAAHKGSGQNMPARSIGPKPDDPLLNRGGNRAAGPASQGPLINPR